MLSLRLPLRSERGFPVIHPIGVILMKAQLCRYACVCVSCRCYRHIKLRKVECDCDSSPSSARLFLLTPSPSSVITSKWNRFYRDRVCFALISRILFLVLRLVLTRIRERDLRRGGRNRQ